MRAPTQAAQRMQVAASKAVSASAFGMGVSFASRALPVFTETNPPPLHDPIERPPIDHQVPDDGQRGGSPWPDYGGAPALERSHVPLAGRGAAVRPVRDSVDHGRAHSANALAAIVIAADQFLPAFDQHLVDLVEHLDNRHVKARVACLISPELAAAAD